MVRQARSLIRQRRIIIQEVVGTEGRRRRGATNHLRRCCQSTAASSPPRTTPATSSNNDNKKTKQRRQQQHPAIIRSGSAVIYHPTAILEECRQQNPQRAQELYLELLQARQSGNRDAQPTVELLQSILTAWRDQSEASKSKASSSPQAPAPQQAEDLLRHVQEVMNHYLDEVGDDGDLSKKNAIQPTIECYNLVIECWSRSKDPNALQHVQQIVESMEHHPNDDTYFLLAKMTLKRGGAGDWNGAKKISQKMQQPNPKLTGMLLHQMTRTQDPQSCEDYFRHELSESEQNTITYSMILSAWARAKQPQQAERLLLEMVHQQWSSMSAAVDHYRHQEESKLPDRGAFHIVMDAWASSNSKKAAERVESLLTRFWHYYESGQIEAMPSVETYERVIRCWLQSRYDGACLHAEEMVRSMQQHYYYQKSSQYEYPGDDEESSSSLKPTPKLVNLILEAWIRRGNPERAEALLHAMAPTSVDSRSYLVVLNAWSSLSKQRKKTETAGARTRIPALLGKVHEAIVETGTLLQQGKMTVTTLNKLLHLFSTHGVPDKGLDILRVTQSKRNKKLKPDTVSYNSVMNGLAGDVGKFDIVETLLQEMVDSFRSGSKLTPHPTSTSFAIALKALSHQEFQETFHEKKLWSILDMIGSLGANKDQSAAGSHLLDTNVYNNAIRCAAAWQQPKLAIQLIKSMIQAHSDGRKDAKPNQVSFGTAISACTKGGNVDEAVKLFQMVDQNPHVTPDCRMYCAIMTAWGKSNHPEAVKQVERLFDEMIGRYQDGDRSLKPDGRAFHIVMSTLARTGDGGRVEEYLRRADLKPTVWHFNATILAWSKSSDPQAFEKAESLLYEMQAGGIRPDSVTYFVLLQMLSTRSIPDKQKRTEDIISNFRASEVEVDDRIEAVLEALDVMNKPLSSSSSNLVDS